jgi:hypothetical protein
MASTIEHEHLLLGTLLCGDFPVPTKPADSSDILKEETDDKDKQVSRALLCFLMAGGSRGSCEHRGTM